ncbi:hypothetical protein [Legionella tunisiensis]|uniref:hypothetical protein n=1 Tax=Legionella tunisiensis TaxID=1034944 RepID=UPI00036C6FFD|nr:hypothetical protein [Legionella tunisiensis]
MFRKSEPKSTVASHAVIAMKQLMFVKKDPYEQAIKDLAVASANLIKKGQKVQDVITIIENSMKASHEKVKGALVSEIGMAQFQKSPALAGQIKAMATYKNQSIESIIEAVVTDALVRANKDYGADLGDFNPAEYHGPEAAEAPAPQS